MQPLTSVDAGILCPSALKVAMALRCSGVTLEAFPERHGEYQKRRAYEHRCIFILGRVHFAGGIRHPVSEEDGGLYISVPSVLRAVFPREFFRNVLHFPVNPGNAEICLSQAESGNSICFAGNRCGAN
jgi:hypothetical protein